MAPDSGHTCVHVGLHGWWFPHHLIHHNVVLKRTSTADLRMWRLISCPLWRRGPGLQCGGVGERSQPRQRGHGQQHLTCLEDRVKERRNLSFPPPPPPLLYSQDSGVGLRSACVTVTPGGQHFLSTSHRSDFFLRHHFVK